MFAERVLDWFGLYGRKHLPWQQNKTPYRVWVSEIMLQQTQVATAIPYFNAFIKSFPTLDLLAEASEDDVLAHWSGLGYYARARNMHKCAKLAVAQYGGELPTEIDELVAMPGIGRSTASAILSLALGQPHPILDGNVKRVLARHQAVAGWPGKSSVLNRLWYLSEEVTPTTRTAQFNQAMMDLGATVCTRSRPLCERCPISADCQGLIRGNPLDFPGRKPKKKIPVRHTVMLALSNSQGRMLLERRPPTGIWGGLWSLPEVESVDDIANWLHDSGLSATADPYCAAKYRHTFSHYHLDIDVQAVDVDVQDSVVAEWVDKVWTDGQQLPGGVAAPVYTILSRLLGELL